MEAAYYRKLASVDWPTATSITDKAGEEIWSCNAYSTRRSILFTKKKKLEVSTIVISSPEGAKDMLKTHDLHFAQRPEVGATVIMPYDN